MTRPSSSSALGAAGPVADQEPLVWSCVFPLRKDLDLGLKAAKELGVPLPVTKVARGEVDKLVQAGHTECDFAILIEQAATAAGMKLTPENVAVDDGLKKKSA